MATKKMLFVALLMLAIALTNGVAYSQGNQTGPAPTATPTFEWTSLLTFLAILIGVLGRAFLPYWRKLIAGEKLTFQMRYIAIVIASFVTAIQVFPNYSPVLDSILITFWSALTFGFGLQSLYTEVYQWIEDAVEKATATPPTPT